ncbi:MAG: SpoIID/LytB domain-containing protein [Candidatus Methylomirabilia bacterium]
MTFEVAPAFANGLIRVAVADGVRSVQIGGGPVRVLDLAGGAVLEGRARWLRVSLRDGALQVAGVRLSAARLRPLGTHHLRINGHLYPGILEVLRNGNGLTVVNELPLDAYLVGVLAAEAADDWPVEALKAQAIAARTFALYHRRLNAAKPFHLVASTAHQRYAGSVPASSPLWLAVKETAGEVLRWEGQLFPAFYHADSGGHTEDPRKVFDAPNMPALKPVRSDFSAGAPHYAWSLGVPLSELAGVLRKGGISVGRILRLEVLERSRSLRVLRMAVHGTRGRATVRGVDLRRLLGARVLKSTLFVVSVDGAYARFTGRGYGHGVGLSQWGAKGMAEQGYGYREILRFYYPGSILSTVR